MKIKKDKLYQIAKESIRRYGNGMLNFKDKPNIISTHGLKFSFPSTFNDVSKEESKEMAGMEGKEGIREELSKLKSDSCREIIIINSSKSKTIIIFFLLVMWWGVE